MQPFTADFMMKSLWKISFLVACCPFAMLWHLSQSWHTMFSVRRHLKYVVCSTCCSRNFCHGCVRYHSLRKISLAPANQSTDVEKITSKVSPVCWQCCCSVSVMFRGRSWQDETALQLYSHKLTFLHRGLFVSNINSGKQSENDLFVSPPAAKRNLLYCQPFSSLTPELAFDRAANPNQHSVTLTQSTLF